MGNLEGDVTKVKTDIAFDVGQPNNHKSVDDRLNSATTNNQAIKNDIGPSAIKDRVSALEPKVTSIENDIAITEGKYKQ